MLIQHWLWSWTCLDALGWTLLHSLWQGTIAAVALAAILRASRGASSAPRYLIAAMAMAAVVATSVATFVHLNQTAAPALAPADHFAPAVQTASDAKLVEIPPAGHSITSFAQRLRPAIPWLGLTWAVGVVILGCSQLAGWTLILRLGSSARPIVDAALPALFDQLVDLLGISRGVRLAQSGLVQVPTVIGWLRPIVLLPASALTGLTADQLRGLLAHELAHVRRCDYLANLIQAAIETLFFYHPAVWWIGRRIREEREHCCDDVAAAICDRADYARALARMEHLRQTPSPAMSARGGVLLPRIRRLLSGGRKTSSPGWSWVVPALLLIAVVCLLAIHQPQAKADNAATQPSQPVYWISGVPRSGVYELADGHRTVRQALNDAGFSDDPALKLLLLVRRDNSGVETRDTFDLDQVISDPAAQLVIQDNDVLLVEDKPPSGEYYLGGDAPRTGPYSMIGHQVSLLQALVAAGVDPVKQSADMVRIVRRGGKAKGSEVFFEREMMRLVDGNDGPFMLEANDIIMVIHSPNKDAHEVRLVVAKDEMTFEGAPVTLDNLHIAIESLPDAQNTALQFAVQSEDVPPDRKYEAMKSAVYIVAQLHMKSITDIGIRPLGSKSADQ
jgi:beta-lactamase regulating signal transducer with metallopeptidase domain/protein involved in polysaccharide export with SLBB domain